MRERRLLNINNNNFPRGAAQKWRFKKIVSEISHTFKALVTCITVTGELLKGANNFQAISGENANWVQSKLFVTCGSLAVCEKHQQHNRAGRSARQNICSEKL